MKAKIIFTFVGLIIFLICFTTSLKLRDYFYEQNLRSNLQKIKVGMSEKEAIEILGKPTSQYSSDSTEEVWCYDTDSVTRILEDQGEIRCGHLLLQMNSPRNGRVVEVCNFDD